MAIDTTTGINSFLRNRRGAGGFGMGFGSTSVSSTAQAATKSSSQALSATVNSQKNLQKSTDSAAGQMLKFAKVMAAARIAGAALVAINEKALQARLKKRGDFAALTERQLGPSTFARMASSIGLGFVAELEKQKKERLGFVDAANAAKFLQTSFESLRDSVDSSAASLAQQQIANKFRRRPEEGAFQQRALGIKTGFGRQATEARGLFDKIKKDADEAAERNKIGRQAEIDRVDTSKGPLRRQTIKEAEAREQEEATAIQTKARFEEAQDKESIIIKAEEGVEKLKKENIKTFHLDRIFSGGATSVGAAGALGVSQQPVGAAKEDKIVDELIILNNSAEALNRIIEGMREKKGVED